MSNKRFIQLLEVYCGVAGARKGAHLGIDALSLACDEIDCKYFHRYPIKRIKDEKLGLAGDSEFKHLKYMNRVTKVISQVATTIEDIKNNNRFPIILAGDHSTSAGTMHGLKMAYPKDEIGVVYIDAHADIHSVYTSHSGNMHGMPLAIACSLDNEKEKRNKPSKQEIEKWEELKNIGGTTPSIKPENIIFCGLRDYEEEEKSLINQYGIKKFSAKKITYLGVKSVVNKIFDRLSHCKHIYVSFDVDSIDPYYIPGTGTPAKHGLSLEQAMQLNIQLIKNKKVCAWEIAEINPLFDKNQEGTKSLLNIVQAVTAMLVKHY